MKKLVLACLILFCGVAFAQNIACVDMKKVWESSKEIQAEKKKLEDMLKKSEAELKVKENELKGLQERAQREGQMMSDEAKRELQETFQKKYLEFQELYQKNQKKLQEKDVQATGGFIEKVKKIATELAKKRGFDMVLAKDSLLFIQDKYDITQDVLKEINK